MLGIRPAIVTSGGNISEMNLHDGVHDIYAIFKTLVGDDFSKIRIMSPSVLLWQHCGLRIYSVSRLHSGISAFKHVTLSLHSDYRMSRTRSTT